MSLYVLCCSVNGSVCLCVACLTVFVIECDGVVECGWSCSIA